MPSLVNLAELRYQVLDRCFSDKNRYYFIDDLLKAVNTALRNDGWREISERTLWNTIREMENNPNWNVVLINKKKDGRRYFRYVDPTYSIYRQDLDERQLAQLKSMLLMLRQFHDLEEFDRIKELLKQLEQHYNFTLGDTQNIISYDTDRNVDGMEFLSPLFEAITTQQALEITYQPYNKDAYTRIIHPYFIKQYNGRWFLLGLEINEPYRNITNMALDRIQKIDVSLVPYIPNTEYDFREYFADIIGVSLKKHQEPIKIALRVAEKRIQYVLTKPIHGSQRNHRKDEGIIELELIPNREFYQRLLSFGGDIEILSPDSVREEMAKKAEELYNLYKGTSINSPFENQ